MKRIVIIFSVMMFVIANVGLSQDIINEMGKDGKFIVRDAEQQEAMVIEDGNVGITGELSVEQMNEGSVSNPYVVWDPTDKKFKTVARIFSNISPISKPLVDRTWHNLAYDKVDEAGNLLNVQATAVTWNQFNTDFGWIKLGPADANFAHIYTDRSRFMFNKPVTFYTGEFGTAVGNDLQLQAGGVTRLIFKASNGNVGIGTTSPDEKLHVVGNIKIDGRLGIGGSPSTSWDIFSHSAGGAVFAGKVRAGQFEDYSNAAYHLDPADADISLVVAGKVGVGTTSPLSKLFIEDSQGASSTTPILTINNTAISGQNMLDMQYQGATVGRLRTAATSSFYIENMYNTDIRFRTNNATRMTIQNNGNVGIGTIGPSQKMQIASGHIGMDDSYGIFWGGTDVAIYGSNAGGYLRLKASVADAMTINSGGNVGIGTINPLEALHVSGKIRSDTGFNIKNSDGVTGTYNFYNDGTTSDQVTSITVNGGIITTISTIP